MPQLLLVNPRKRKAKAKAKAKAKPKAKAKTSAKQKRTANMAKRRTAAQRRATRKLIAFNKSRKSLNKRRAPKRRRRNPVTTLAAAPRRRRRRSVTMSRPRRRNPSRRTNIVMKTAPQALTAAVGALGLDVVMGYANQYLPQNFATGALNSVAKVIGAIGLGMVVEKIANKRVAEQVIIGGMTVTAHSLLRNLVATNAPSIPLAGCDGELGWYTAAPVASDGMNGFGMNPMAAYSPTSRMY